MIRLSIIIPVFNVEEFIGECISSCLRQNIPGDEYEIIIVNDCSTDKSIKVAQKCHFDFITSVKPELRIVSSSNDSVSKGAAAARNIGLRVARGEYIWFIDSDDKIEDNFLAELKGHLAKDDLQILRFGYKLLFDDNRTETHVNEATPLFEGKCLYAKYPHPVGVWSFVFKREFLLSNSIVFIEGIMFEDQAYSPVVHWFAERTKMLSIAPYFYRQRAGSVMKSNVSRFKVDSALTVCEFLHRFSEAHHDAEFTPVLSRQIAFMFSNALNINSQCKEPVSLNAFKQCHCYPLQDVSEWKYRLINYSLHLSSLACRVKALLTL